MLNNKKINISNNKTNKFFEYDVCGCVVRIKDKSIKSQDMEILRDGKVIGIIREDVSRTYNGCIAVCYGLGNGLYDTLEETIERLIYNLDR